MNAGNVKKYMLYNLVPSKEITGGPWYHNGEFDYGFIKELQKTAIAFIQREHQATAAQVHLNLNLNPNRASTRLPRRRCTQHFHSTRRPGPPRPAQAPREPAASRRRASSGAPPHRRLADSRSR